MAKAEAEIQKAVQLHLMGHGFFCWRNHTQGIRMKGRMLPNPNAGAPDLMALKDGTFYCIEIKTPIGKVAQNQVQWLSNARGQGAVTMVVTSVEDLIERLADLKDPGKIPFVSDMIK